MWLQFRRRLDRLQPFCRIAGHTSEEVREILVALETIYRSQFPDLNLHQWTGAITTWLTHPLLDPANSGRVVMDHLMKLVMTALEWTAARGETEVRAETLQAAAEVLTLRQDAIQFIDGPTGCATSCISRGKELQAALRSPCVWCDQAECPHRHEPASTRSTSAGKAPSDTLA